MSAIEKWSGIAFIGTIVSLFYLFKVIFTFALPLALWHIQVASLLPLWPFTRIPNCLFSNKTYLPSIRGPLEWFLIAL